LVGGHGTDVIVGGRAPELGTLFAVLHEPGTAGLTFELVAGDTPITEAVALLAAV
jgi:hypothetical protein